MNRTATGLVLIGLMLAALGTLQFFATNWFGGINANTALNATLMKMSWVVGGIISIIGVGIAALGSHSASSPWS